jgi:hypothetical protein
MIKAWNFKRLCSVKGDLTVNPKTWNKIPLKITEEWLLLKPNLPKSITIICLSEYKWNCNFFVKISSQLAKFVLLTLRYDHLIFFLVNV